MQAKDVIGGVIPNAVGFRSTAAITEKVSAEMNLTPAAARSPHNAEKRVVSKQHLL
jgi:hypothetical protein